jgi:sulfhydrogenase subunit beta (sulfur reductase)
MSDAFILDKNHLPYWLRQLRKERRLIAPMAGVSGDLVYEEVGNIHDIQLEGPALLPPVKEFFIPRTEVMFRFQEGKVQEQVLGVPTVIFGLRSCDVAALHRVDRFMAGKFQDPYYAKKRENTILISIGCNKPDATCFCMSMGTGPFLQEGHDIQLTDLESRYFVEAGSQRAWNLLRKFRYLFSKPSKADYEDQYEAVHLARTYFEKRLNLEGARKSIIGGDIDDAFWELVTKRCLECGGCVYECPICTCFNVLDRREGENVERLRVWDTCLFKGFTRMAGGVLPNEKRIKRTKRWYEHKIVHGLDQTGEFGCVGCGRCTVTCPGSIDMATVGMQLIKGVELP